MAAPWPPLGHGAGPGVDIPPARQPPRDIPTWSMSRAPAGPIKLRGAPRKLAAIEPLMSTRASASGPGPGHAEQTDWCRCRATPPFAAAARSPTSLPSGRRQPCHPEPDARLAPDCILDGLGNSRGKGESTTSIRPQATSPTRCHTHPRYDEPNWKTMARLQKLAVHAKGEQRIRIERLDERQSRRANCMGSGMIGAQRGPIIPRAPCRFARAALPLIKALLDPEYRCSPFAN